MAKIYESDIDPDEFIRSFSKDTSGMKADMERGGSDSDNDRKSKVRKEVGSTKEKADEAADMDFLDKYVRNMAHMRPQGRYLMVEICPEYIRRIKRILSYASGPSCSVKAYVNNVLSEHFREYGETIKKML